MINNHFDLIESLFFVIVLGMKSSHKAAKRCSEFNFLDEEFKSSSKGKFTCKIINLFKLSS